MKTRIKDLREDRDLRQIDVATATGIDQRTISNYESGKTSPDAEALVRLADFFNVSVDYLLYRTEYNAYTNEKKRELIETIQQMLESLKQG